MWLSGLHIPESYLTALVQATCRKNGWPLDKSTLYTSVTEVNDTVDLPLAWIFIRVRWAIDCWSQMGYRLRSQMGSRLGL